eukprot:c22596_g1_i1 orf=385-1356(+)
MARLRLSAFTNCLSGQHLSPCLPGSVLGFAGGRNGYRSHAVSRVGSVIFLTGRTGPTGWCYKNPALVKWNQWKQTRFKEHCSKGSLQVSANSKADDSLPSAMSLENALQLLGVAEGASFEDILKAKKTLLTSNTENHEFATQVEVAYDLLLMHSLMERQAGKVEDKSILYADVKVDSNSTGFEGVGDPDWLRGAFSKLPVMMEHPSPSSLVTKTAVYAALMAWTYTHGLFSHEVSSNEHADVPGLILAVGFGTSIYFLRKQNVKLEMAATITVFALIVGAVLGGAVESWLQVDVIPLFGNRSLAVVVSECVLLSCWLSLVCLH